MLHTISEMMAWIDAQPLGNGIDFALAAVFVAVLIYATGNRQEEN